MRLELTINAGIGDIIHSHAMLEAARPAVTEVAVAVDHAALQSVRNVAHSEFATRLAQFVFREPTYTIVPQSTDGMTPQQLVGAGLPMAVPDLRDVLPLDGIGRPPEPFVAVSTKVRSLRRDRYEQMRLEFLHHLTELAKRVQLVVIGERMLSMTPEYQGHGDGFAYSIYDDLMTVPCVDATFPEYGNVPAQWDQFRMDCTVMRNAERVITLGTGGNVSMAMACGRCLCLIQQTEMEWYFRAMPPDERITCAETPAEYLEEIGRT